ncbi:hypothetical protein CDD81_4739 [Ophiocordyceps australis]|uniref:Ecp2 effector protein domain-containing protein n=1 Tax=Ophiocordyceps australis TaxID=1399860 RepID=A0A2C5XTF7_9HYPO|nr:hypothetical protein CDD81_4739 [Ophiocordyceps australis]
MRSLGNWVCYLLCFGVWSSAWFASATTTDWFARPDPGPLQYCRERLGWVLKPESRMFGSLKLPAVNRSKPKWLVSAEPTCARMQLREITECINDSVNCNELLRERKINGSKEPVALANCVDLWEPTRRVGRGKNWYCYGFGSTGVYTLCKGPDSYPDSCQTYSRFDLTEVGRGAMGRGNVDQESSLDTNVVQLHALRGGPQSVEVKDAKPQEKPSSKEASKSALDTFKSTLDTSKSVMGAFKSAVDPSKSQSCWYMKGWEVDLRSARREQTLPQEAIMSGPGWLRPLQLTCMRMRRTQYDSCHVLMQPCWPLIPVEADKRGSMWTPLAQCSDFTEPPTEQQVFENWWYCPIGTDGSDLFSLCRRANPKLEECGLFDAREPQPQLDWLESTDPEQQGESTDEDRSRIFNPYIPRCNDGSWHIWPPASNKDGIDPANDSDNCGYNCFAVSKVLYLAQPAEPGKGGCPPRTGLVGHSDQPTTIPLPEETADFCHSLQGSGVTAAPTQMICVRDRGTDMAMVACLGGVGLNAEGCVAI